MNEVSGKWVAVGRVASCHGLTGAVKVRPLTDLPERLQKLEKVLVKGPSLRNPRVFTVESAVPLGRLWAVKLTELDSREAAGALVGGLLLVPQQERAVLPGGAYYIDQIIGLAVCDESGNLLGRITAVRPTGGHDLYVVQPEAEQAAPDGNHPDRPGGKRKQEWLLPAVKNLVIEINLTGGFMRVRLPKGLTEL